MRQRVKLISQEWRPSQGSILIQIHSPCPETYLADFQLQNKMNANPMLFIFYTLGVMGNLWVPPLVWSLWPSYNSQQWLSAMRNVAMWPLSLVGFLKTWSVNIWARFSMSCEESWGWPDLGWARNLCFKSTLESRNQNLWDRESPLSGPSRAWEDSGKAEAYMQEGRKT